MNKITKPKKKLIEIVKINFKDKNKKNDDKKIVD